MHVFISHATEDEAIYGALCLALDGKGIPRWDVEEMTAGQSLADQLRQAIKNCDVCVFLVTQSSIDSKWCLAEVGAFWGAGKAVVMYVCDPQISEDKLPPQFTGKLWTSKALKLFETLESIVPSRTRRKKSSKRTKSVPRKRSAKKKRTPPKSSRSSSDKA